MEPRSSRRNQRNRRHYALPKFDFEDATHAPQGSDELISYTLATSSSNTQHPVPVSPCINATDRAQRARLRLASASQPLSQETFCDNTPLLQDNPKRKPAVDVVDEGDIPDMQLSEDEELGEEFEVIEKRECGVVHNGTVRRWWRGFRH
jgi:hypothetical protein